MIKLKILAISGSLKSTSSNTTILKYLSTLKNDQVECRVYNQIDHLPHFNPENEDANEAVKNFKISIKESDGVIFSTPEYAFGVPGVLKNALDWTVSSGDLNEKPVLAISASPMYGGGDKALASLLLTLSALGTKMTKESSLSIPDIQNKIKNREVADSKTQEKLASVFDQFIYSIMNK